MGLVNSNSAIERSVAVRLLSSKTSDDDVLTLTLLNRLCIEKSLYTKLELCTALEKGDITTARQMIEYLGVIGTNQHKTLPNHVSKKISYPLPRDIIARSLGRMDICVFPALLEVLHSKDVMKLLEVIDAIGFMVFYHQELSSIQNLKYMTDLIDLYSSNEMIVWKATICLSAFTLNESINYLNALITRYNQQIIKDEVVRSKNLILRRNETEHNLQLKM